MSLVFGAHDSGRSLFSSRRQMAMPPVLTDADLAVLASHGRRRKARAERFARLAERLRSAFASRRG